MEASLPFISDQNSYSNQSRVLLNLDVDVDRDLDLNTIDDLGTD